MLHDLIATWFQWVHDWGYAGVVLLMAMESSIFPVPSEVVIPPAAFAAAQGTLSIWGVILAGVFGSWLGASATYLAAATVGRVFVARWGRYVLISPDKLDRTERFLHRYEAGGVFFSRLLPVVRHLIGIPCGLVKMNFAVFSLMTVLGSTVWCSVLAWYGYRLGTTHPDAVKDPQQMVAAVKADLLWIVLACIVLAGSYLLTMWLTRPKTTSNP